MIKIKLKKQEKEEKTITEGEVQQPAANAAQPATGTTQATPDANAAQTTTGAGQQATGTAQAATDANAAQTATGQTATAQQNNAAGQQPADANANQQAEQAKATLLQINKYMSTLFNNIKNACSAESVQKAITNLTQYPEAAKKLETSIQAFSGMTIDENPDNINKSIESFTAFLQSLNEFARSVNELTAPQK